MYIFENNGLHYGQLFNFLAHPDQRRASHTSVPHTVSMLRPFLCFIISYVDAPCLWNIKTTMTGTILETKQKVTWSSAHQQ